MAKPISFLRKILRLLVEEYGEDKVLQELVVLEKEVVRSSVTGHPEGKSRKFSKRKTASQIVTELDIENSQKKALVVRMAEQFDQKSFLPTIGVIKSFLDSRGYTGKLPKSRQDAAKTIIGVLNKASNEDLEFLLNNKQFTGPSQLQDLSEAISKTGASLRGRNDESVELYSSDAEVKNSSPT